MNFGVAGVVCFLYGSRDVWSGTFIFQALGVRHRSCVPWENSDLSPAAGAGQLFAPWQGQTELKQILAEA